MARRKLGKRSIRKIARSMRGSYRVTIPVEIIRKYRWRENQKVIIKPYGRKKIIIEDQ